MKMSVESPITIRKKLRKDKCKILSSGRIMGLFHEDFWDAVKSAYIAQAKDPEFIECGRFNPELLNRLKEKKESVMNLLLTRDTYEVYIQAKKWCVAPHTIGSRAKAMGFSFLNMNPNSDEDMEIWKMRVNDYKHFKWEIDMTDIIGIELEIPIEEKVRRMKRLGIFLFATLNYEPDAEPAWHTLTRWFTKNRP